MTRIGLFAERIGVADLLWSQCDDAYGRHGDIQLVVRDPAADHVLVIGLPYGPGPSPRLAFGDRLASRWRGDSARRKLEAAWEALGTERERTSVLFYEPSTYVKDVHYEVARRHAARVYGTDERATHAIPLPCTWLVPEDVHALRQEQPRDKPIDLAIVTSGKSYLPGHKTRLAFLQRLRAAGIDFELFGHGLDPALASRGPVLNKGAALRPARYTLALENHDEGDCYVTEKIWDPLLCWSLPLYNGPKAAERVLPAESFIRLPDLGAAGVEVVREALAHPAWWEERRDAIAEARRRILGELRMVEWIRREIAGPAERSA
jgi:hypothetical protein